MREIKFRAWDKKRKEIIYFDLKLLADESLSFYNEQIKNNNVMQFTGLHDKNGREIYEGDVWERSGFIGKVVFEHSGWVIVTLPSSRFIEYPAFYSNASTGEIIGNIHENPSPYTVGFYKTTQNPVKP